MFNLNENTELLKSLTKQMIYRNFVKSLWHANTSPVLVITTLDTPQDMQFFNTVSLFDLSDMCRFPLKNAKTKKKCNLINYCNHFENTI